MPISPGSGSLVDRALVTRLVYNFLSKVTPEDIYGVQKALVDINGDEVTVDVPKASDASVLAKYGIVNTTVPKMHEPSALIPRMSPQDILYEEPIDPNLSIRRALLRRIVDEV